MAQENKHTSDPDATQPPPNLRREAVARRVLVRIGELEAFGLERSSADDLLWVLRGAYAELTGAEPPAGAE